MLRIPIDESWRKCRTYLKNYCFQGNRKNPLSDTSPHCILIFFLRWKKKRRHTNAHTSINLSVASLPRSGSKLGAWNQTQVIQTGGRGLWFSYPLLFLLSASLAGSWDQPLQLEMQPRRCDLGCGHLHWQPDHWAEFLQPCAQLPTFLNIKNKRWWLGR